MSFASLKRGSEFDKLKKQMEATTQPNDAGGKDDPRFWTPSTDKAGNGMATVRFLPSPAVDGDDGLPWVRFWKHGFQGPGGWLIDDCLTTITQPCPVCEYNTIKWNSGVESDKEIARKQKRKLTYISNVLVISDPANPDNNGKVFKFRFGVKLFEKIVAAAKPDESLGETPINAFDPMSGADFLLKQKKVAGFPNFDESKFNSAKEMFDGNENKIQEVLDQCFDLNAEIAPDKFKSAEELKKKYLWVMGLAESTSGKPASKAQKEQDDELDSLAKMVEEPIKKKASVIPMPTMGADDEDDSAFFASLIND